MSPSEAKGDMTSERQVLCSRCLELTTESRVHVIPYFNDSVGSYVTTYRCERCWEPSLKETRSRLSATEDAAEITSVAEFFKRHDVFLHEYLRGDPPLIVRERLIQMLDLLRRGAIRLSIGATRTLD